MLEYIQLLAEAFRDWAIAVAKKENEEANANRIQFIALINGAIENNTFGREATNLLIDVRTVLREGNYTLYQVYSAVATVMEDVEAGEDAFAQAYLRALRGL